MVANRFIVSRVPESASRVEIKHFCNLNLFLNREAEMKPKESPDEKSGNSLLLIILAMAGAIALLAGSVHALMIIGG